jgi:FAS-associated factor 2
MYADTMQNAQPGASQGVPPRPHPPNEPRASSRVNNRQALVDGPRPLPPLLSIPMNVLGISFGLIAKLIGMANAVLGAAARRVLPRRVHRALGDFLRRLLPRPRITDPVVAATEFIQDFSAKYGERTPKWQISGWQAASQKAQAEGSFLFVYLHAPHHQDTDGFCKDTLCSPAFVDYLNSTFISWGGDIRNPEAYRLASNLRVSKYPYCALLAFSGPRTRLITFTEGPVRPEALAELLQAALVGHGGLLWEDRLLQEQRDNDRRLREEQDAEYQRSLEADRARALEKQKQEETRQRLQQEKEEKELQERKRLEEEEKEKQRIRDMITQRRLEKRRLLLVEPEAQQEDVSVIRIRFPSGETHQRRFISSKPFQHVVDWVESLECNDFAKFSLATTYPRQVLTVEQFCQTLEDLQFGKQIALAIQEED